VTNSREQSCFNRGGGGANIALITALKDTGNEIPHNTSTKHFKKETHQEMR